MSDRKKRAPVTTIAPAREESEVLAAIFARIAEGDATVRASDAEGMNRRTFWRRVAANEDIRTAYEVALTARAHIYAEEIMEISDEVPPMVGDTNHKAGESRMDSAAVAWQKLRVDSRKWVISKLLPKKYADKIDIEHTGTMTFHSTPSDNQL